MGLKRIHLLFHRCIDVNETDPRGYVATMPYDQANRADHHDHGSAFSPTHLRLVINYNV
jgi:hypothetical protein